LIGHEGEGSLLSHLKKLGLVSTIVASDENGSPGFNFFSVKFGLTIEGLS
jgi:insulysin